MANSANIKVDMLNEDPSSLTLLKCDPAAIQSPGTKPMLKALQSTPSQLRVLAESFILPGHASEVDQIMVFLPASEENSGSLHEEREMWGSGLEYLLSCIGFAVGLGNIWRFPYLCFKSGGGAFLIPYFSFLVLCGFPLFYLETAYGQFASLSPITVWRISPLFKGIGYGMVTICGIVCVYYNIIIAWTFYYIYMTMNGTLPWTTCNNKWNTDRCVATVQDKFKNQNSLNVSARNAIVFTGNVSVSAGNASVSAGNASVSAVNASVSVGNASSQFFTASLEFWEYAFFIGRLFHGLMRLVGLNIISNIGKPILWPLFMFCHL